MITPSKFISFEQSIIARLPSVLRRGEVIGIHDLYEEVEDQFQSVDEFIYALDVLFILDEIDVDFSAGMIRYVG